jgi:hypothetical protein
VVRINSRYNEGSTDVSVFDDVPLDGGNAQAVKGVDSPISKMIGLRERTRDQMGCPKGTAFLILALEEDNRDPKYFSGSCLALRKL